MLRQEDGVGTRPRVVCLESLTESRVQCDRTELEHGLRTGWRGLSRPLEGDWCCGNSSSQ